LPWTPRNPLWTGGKPAWTACKSPWTPCKLPWTAPIYSVNRQKWRKVSNLAHAVRPGNSHNTSRLAGVPFMRTCPLSPNPFPFLCEQFPRFP
jgi:hypothetical protein